MEKIVLRKIYKEKRDNILNKDQKDQAIFNKLIQNKNIIACDTLLIYISINSEVDTLNIIKYFIDTKKIAVPKIIKKEMVFCYINNLDELEIGKYNIPEPISNNIVSNFENAICITPGICFDLNNYRVGYGKGYYDTFLNKTHVKTIGLCYKECLTNKIDTNNFDYKIDEVITD